MSDLKISLVQYDIIWQSPSNNLSQLEELLSMEVEETDLIILPEMFTTGFDMDPKPLAEQHRTTTFKWLQMMAKRFEAAICGSVMIKEGDAYFNRFYMVFEDGHFEYYDKKHLFRFAGEHEQYTAGEQLNIIRYKGWNICPQICYDLRFPVWSRNIDLNYDILLYVANWPAKRQTAWNTLLPARAIENNAYCIGVNRVGKDGNQHEYEGGSAIYSPTGETKTQLVKTECIINYTLSKKELTEYRESFQSWKDSDSFRLI